MNHTVVVLVGSVHRGVLEALAYARSLSPNHLLAVSRRRPTRRSRSASSRRGRSSGSTSRSRSCYSPYRELTRPILRYIDELDARYENDIITVVLPEFVVRHWWGNLLHNQRRSCSRGGCSSARARS